MLRTIIPLDQGWEFAQSGSDSESATKYRPVSQFPTNVHLDLLHHGLIEDPYIGKNETKVQWVGEATWLYRTSFDTPPEKGKGSNVVLSFDGLDTFATVTLNGKEILKTENMFIPERVEVGKYLQEEEGQRNELVIEFDSALKRGEELVKKDGEHKWGCWNGDVSRLPVRKAQYHWGWDWGPMLMTCGPWRPINLEVYDSRITDLYTDVKVDDSLESAEVTVHASIEGAAESVRFDVYVHQQKVASETVKADDKEEVQTTFAIQRPTLWYPIGYGSSDLYTITATLLGKDDTSSLDESTKKIGLRKVEVVQEEFKDPSQKGASFYFRVNNVPIFCGGSNWIPADNFIPRISKERYRDWVRLLAGGRQVMLRVWAGGIYEEDVLYDLCDEMGVLVWQDFLFACGNYPTSPEFLKSVEREAEVNVKRLRHHPSIVIWAGNNEDYQYAEGEKLTYNWEDKDPESWLKTDFPARYIYEHLLPKVCEKLTDTFYHPGSPFGAGKPSGDKTVGDLHQWNVWHGTQERYQDWGKLMGRFISEFGMEAFPNVKTIDGYLPQGKDDPDRYPQSSTVDFHNKATGHERRLALYLVENIRYRFDPLEDYIYCTQLIQAECLASAYREWRRQWGVGGAQERYCGGALVWQINDCWPVTSWSICDYHLRPKHAYYAIKREMMPYVVGIDRRKGSTWVSNLTLTDEDLLVVQEAWDIATGKKVHSAERVVRVKANSVVEQDFDIGVASEESSDNVVICASIFRDPDNDHKALYGWTCDWPQPLKYIHLPKPKALKVELVESFGVANGMVRITTDVPIKGLALECEDEEVEFDDNLVDVVPSLGHGRAVEVVVRGAKGDTKITTRCLNLIV